MRTVLIGLGLMSIALMSAKCDDEKVTVRLEQAAPFKASEAFVQKWVGGMTGSGSSYSLEFQVDGLTDDVSLDSVYFRGNKLPLVKVIFKDRTIFKASYAKALKTKLPVTLLDSEAVIKYRKTGKARFWKLTDIEEKQPLFHP